jgi:hypothetical protein
VIERKGSRLKLTNKVMLRNKRLMKEKLDLALLKRSKLEVRRRRRTSEP